MKRLLIILSAVLLSCETKATPAEVPGVYRMTYAGLTDTLKVRTGGAFEHFVEKGHTVVFHEEGTWRWETDNFDQNERVSFEAYTCMVPGMEASGLWPAIVEKRFARVRLIMSEDRGLFYWRDKGM